MFCVLQHLVQTILFMIQLSTLVTFISTNIYEWFIISEFPFFSRMSESVQHVAHLPSPPGVIFYLLWDKVVT